MTGPSPWRLSSPRRGPDIGHSIWVHDRACWLNNSSPRPCYYITSCTRNVKQRRRATITRQRRGSDMNVTLITAIVLLLGWGTLVFGAHLGSGPVHLLYAVSVILFARRIIVGAPTFRS